jgi:GMP synthase (glutamine-hydrolysing)
MTGITISPRTLAVWRDGLAVSRAPIPVYRRPHPLASAGRPRERTGALGMGTVLFVEHQAEAPAGLAEVWARSAGLAPRVLQVEAGTPFPDPRAFDAIVVLGSAASVCDQTLPWLAPELAFVKEAVGANVPVLGICFGGQLLSAALGGEVRPSASGPEIGWLQIETDRPSWVPPGPWAEFHFDVFTVPPNATELARTAIGPQAFRFGPHLGIQFHPEVDQAILTDWARDDRGRLARLGIDPAVLDNTPAGWATARANALRLFETWWATARLLDADVAARPAARH